MAPLRAWKQDKADVGLRERLDRLYAAKYSADIGAKLTEDWDPHPQIYDALNGTLAALAGVLRWGLMSLTPGLTLLWPVQALHALTFGLGHLGAMAFVAAAIPPRLQASAQGLYSGGVGGVAIALATLAAGGINAAYGAASAYWLAAAMSGFALIAALRRWRIWDGGRIVKDQT